MVLSPRSGFALFVLLASLALVACGNLYVEQARVFEDANSIGQGTTNPGVLLSVTSIGATEGGATGSYEVSLTGAPAAEVTVTLAPGPQLATSASSLIFTTADWDTPQQVTVTAIDDTAVEGNHSDTIGHTTASLDPAYQGLDGGTVTVSIVDDDAPGVSVTPTNLTVTEGGAGSSYTIVLTTAPAADVTITITDDAQATATPANLTFTTATWDIPQTVSVVAEDDVVFEGAHNGSITHAATSTDPDYGGIAIDDVAVAIGDNEQPLSIYVTSADNVIRVDDMAGSNLIAYNGGGTFSNGMEEVWADAGNIYVADSINDVLYRFDDMTGANLESYNGGGVPFADLRGVFVNGGFIYAATYSRVYRFTDMAGSGQVEFAGGGTPFSRANRLFVDGTGIYVADFDNVTPDPRLYRFDDITGVNLQTFDDGGGAGPVFANVRDVVVDSAGQVYALDLTNGQIYRFDDITGANQQVYDGSAGTVFQTPRALAIDSNDRIYVLDGGTELLYRFDDINGANQVELSIGGSTSSDVFVVGP